MPLPNVSALSLHPVPPTGPNGDGSHSNPLLDINEDPDMFHFHFMTPQIDFAGVRSTDRFYHKTFCPDVSRYATAFACHTKFARAFAAPTDDVFEWLYEEFRKRNMIGTRYVRYETDPNETAFAFFARACRAAFEDRTRLRQRLRDVKARVRAILYPGESMAFASSRYGGGRVPTSTEASDLAAELAPLTLPCATDRAFIAEIIANKDNAYLDLMEIGLRTHGRGTLARLSFYAFVDSELMDDVAFVTGLWEGSNHKYTARDGVTRDYMFDNLTRLVPHPVGSLADRARRGDLALRLVENDPNRILVVLNTAQSLSFLQQFRHMLGRLMQAAVRGKPSLFDALVARHEDEDAGMLTGLEWHGVVIEAQRCATLKVTADAEAINEVGTELLSGHYAIPESLFMAHRDAFKELSKWKFTSWFNNEIHGEREWVKLVMTYLTKFPERVDELLVSDKKNKDLVMSIMVLLPETVPMAEIHLRPYYDDEEWAIMLPHVFSSDEDSDAAADDQQDEDSEG